MTSATTPAQAGFLLHSPFLADCVRASKDAPVASSRYANLAQSAALIGVRVAGFNLDGEPTMPTIKTILKRKPAITMDDLAYELRELQDCLGRDVYPNDADLTAARFIAGGLLEKLKLSPHCRVMP
jgi:hypothetical protein